MAPARHHPEQGRRRRRRERCSTALEREFRPRPLAIGGLGLHRYLGGPWERLATYAFRGR